MRDHWYKAIKPGDMVRPIPLWNQTERRPNQLPDPCKVLAVISASNSQSGVLFRVRTNNGEERELDAGWFKPIS